MANMLKDVPVMHSQSYHTLSYRKHVEVQQHIDLSSATLQFSDAKAQPQIRQRRQQPTN